MRDYLKPPVPIEVRDILNFSRLALGLTEGSQILWHMRMEDIQVLALFTAYMYWKGDLPIIAYVRVDNPAEPFLAYKNDSIKGEEWHFSQGPDDPDSYLTSVSNEDLFEHVTTPRIIPNATGAYASR